MKSMKAALLVMGVSVAVLAAGPAAAGKKSTLLPATDSTIGGPAEVSYGPNSVLLWQTLDSATADICVTMSNVSRGSTATIQLPHGGFHDVPPGETRTACATGENLFSALCEPDSVCAVQWRVDLL